MNYNKKSILIKYYYLFSKVTGSCSRRMKEPHASLEQRGAEICSRALRPKSKKKKNSRFAHLALHCSPVIVQRHNLDKDETCQVINCDRWKKVTHLFIYLFKSNYNFFKLIEVYI